MSKRSQKFESNNFEDNFWRDISQQNRRRKEKTRTHRTIRKTNTRRITIWPSKERTLFADFFFRCLRIMKKRKTFQTALKLNWILFWAIFYSFSGPLSTWVRALLDAKKKKRNETKEKKKRRKKSCCSHMNERCRKFTIKANSKWAMKLMCATVWCILFPFPFCCYVRGLLKCCNWASERHRLNHFKTTATTKININKRNKR